MSDPEAGPRKLSYRGSDIVVEYDVKRCIHAAECVKGHGGVFAPNRHPWVDPARADAGTIAEVIERCPSGALTYRRLDGGPPEGSPKDSVAKIAPSGPLYVSGRIRIDLPGNQVLRMNRAALCRCGASKNKPFCDNTHAETGFTDPGMIEGGRLIPAESGAGESEDAAGEVLVVTCVADGPLLVRGSLTVAAADGKVSRGDKGALCRCGASSTKPFCDGTHRRSGFKSD